MEKGIERWGRLRMMFELEDFHGWDLSTMWDELKFESKHKKMTSKLVAVLGKQDIGGVGQQSRDFSRGSELCHFDQISQTKPVLGSNPLLRLTLAISNSVLNSSSSQHSLWSRRTWIGPHSLQWRRIGKVPGTMSVATSESNTRRIATRMDGSSITADRFSGS